MTTLAHALNVSKDQLGHKDGQIGDLMTQNNNLTALLANKDMLLNKSQVRREILAPRTAPWIRSAEVPAGWGVGAVASL